MFGIKQTPWNLAYQRLYPGTLRGFILWLFGLAIGTVGLINYIATPIPQPTRTYLSFALMWAPGWVFGIVFVSVGLFAVYTSYCHRDSDRIGYTVTGVWMALWGCVYLTGIFYGAGPRTIGASVPWLLYAAILATCARIPRLPFDWVDPQGEPFWVTLRRGKK